MTDLTFTIRCDTPDGDQAGYFSREWSDEKVLDSIQESVESGVLSKEDAAVRARELLREHPKNLEAQNFLGALLWDIECKGEAAELYERSYISAVNQIPKNFRGRISWYELNNRPFLRAAHGHLLALMFQRDGKRAHALARRILKWCPEDNLGIRALMGDIRLLLADYPGALRHYLQTAREYMPTSWYPAALVAFRSGELQSACTYLRKGILGNPYVAEALLGRTLLKDHLYWHGSNLHGCEFAIDYLNSAGNDWTDSEIDFVDWVFNSPAVLRERAALMEVNVALATVHAPEDRRPWVDKSLLLVENLDDQVSKDLVTPVRNRWGEEIHPWDRAGYQQPRARRGRLN